MSPVPTPLLRQIRVVAHNFPGEKRLTQAVDGGIEVGRAAQDLDFEPEEEGRDRRDEVGSEADGVLFRGDEQVESVGFGLPVELGDLAFGETVVVRKPFAVADFRTEVLEEFFKTLRHGDAAEGRDLLALQPLQRVLVGTVDLAEVARPVRALDQFGVGFVAADLRGQFGIGTPVAAGQKDVGGAAEVGDGLAQQAAGQESAVAEGVALIHEQQVDLSRQFEVLETIIKDEGVHPEVLHRVASRRGPVFRHQDDHAGKVSGQHVGFVPGDVGAEQRAVSQADDLRRRLGLVGDHPPEAFPAGLVFAFVTAAEDGDFPALGRQGPGKLLHHRGFPRPAHRQISHRHHQAAQVVALQDTLAEKEEPGPDDALKDQRQSGQHHPITPRRQVVPAVVEHVGGELLEGVETLRQKLARPFEKIAAHVNHLTPPQDSRLTSEKRHASVSVFPTVSFKLFIPGPVNVSEKTYRAMCTPVIGHRSSDFVKLYNDLQPGLQKLFTTKDPVYLSTSSAWGVMEGALRSLCRKKVLNCMNGAFSDKWNDVSKRCGKEAVALKAEWGQPVDPEAVRRELSKGGFDCLTLIHNETSTGTMSPLAEIMAVAREFPEVITIVDTVSSFTAVGIDKDALGIDVMLTGSQKALALPPGLALFSASDRARARAAELPDRGYYFDILEFQANHEKGMTPSTPVLPLIFALKSKVEDILGEGLEARYARHARLNATMHGWVEKHGFVLLPAKEFASKSLSCVKNNRNIDVAEFAKRLKQRHGLVIDGGYGKLKGLTFRVSNMGDETDATIADLIVKMDDAIAGL